MRAVAAAAAVLLTAGCAPAAAPTASSGPPAATQRVGLTEWDVVTSGRPLLAGDAELLVTNAGAAPHDLAVRGAEGSWQTVVLAPGESQTLRLRVRPGETLDLWCTVSGHDAAGMRTSLDVDRG